MPRSILFVLIAATGHTLAALDNLNARPSQFVNEVESQPRFQSPNRNQDRLTLIDTNADSILVGGRDALYNLSTSNLEPQNTIQWKAPGQTIEECHMKGKSESECHNFIRVAASLQNGRILLCGTHAFSPQCRQYEFSPAENRFTERGQFNGQAISPYDPKQNSTFVYLAERDEIFVGAISDFSATDPLIYRKKLDKGESLRTQKDDRVIDEPNFVGSFAFGDFVYFWYREKAADAQDNNREAQYYSRVGRVCANDPGGQSPAQDRWSSFLKVRLNCSIPGQGAPFYFNEIRQFIIQSPRWLASEEKFDKALEVLKKIRRSEQEAMEEWEEVRRTANEDQEMGIRDVWKEGWMRRCLLIGIGVAMCNQLAGVNSIMYYGTEILARTGLGTDAALIANIANGAISVFATGLGIWLLGRIGRRQMLMGGQIGTIASHLLIGTCSSAIPESKTRGFIILSLTVTFLLFQQGGISPVTWLIQSEMFPLRIRGLAMGLSTSVLWMVNFLLSLFFPILIGAIGISATFFLFSGIGLFAVLFVWKWMPETKGKTLEELERQLHAENMSQLRKKGGEERTRKGQNGGQKGVRRTEEERSSEA